jgi:hypothetical protein
MRASSGWAAASSSASRIRSRRVLDLPQRGQRLLGLVLAAGAHHLASDRVLVVGSGRQRPQPLRDLGPFGVAHHRDDVAVVGHLDARLEAGELGGVGRDVSHPGVPQPDPQLGLEVLCRAPAQVLDLVGGDDVVGPQAGDLTEGLEDLVGPVARGAQGEVHAPAGCAQAARDVEQCLETGLVVGEVDDDRHLAALGRHRVGVHPSGVEQVVRAEGAQPLDDELARDAQAQGRRRTGECVEHVVVRQPGQGHRQVDDPHQSVRDSVVGEHGDVAVEHRGGPAAGPEGLAHRGGARVGREDPRAGPDAGAHRPHPGVLAVEHDPSPRLGGLGDDRLDLGELVDRVDALEAEVVGGDVRDDGDVVVRDPHPAQEHPATCGLEDADLHARGVEHGARACRAGVVPRLDGLALDDHAVRGAPPRGQAGRHADVGQQPGRRRLAVRARDRRDRDARGDHPRPVAAGRGGDGGRVGSNGIRQWLPVEQALEHRADRLTERLRATTLAPDEGAHDDVGLACGARANPEPLGSGGSGHGPGHPLDDAHEHLLALLGAGGARLTASAQPDGCGDGTHLVRGCREVPRQRQRHLDGWSGEVQVRPLEQAHLLGAHGRGALRGLAAHAGSLVVVSPLAEAQAPTAW